MRGDGFRFGPIVRASGPVRRRLLHRGKAFAGDHAEGESVNNGHRAETRSAVHAARDFAAGVETLDRSLRPDFLEPRGSLPY